MNLFRSEEHARKWSGYRDDAAGGLLTLEQVMTIFASPMFRERGDPHFLSRLADLRAETVATITQVTEGHPFWSIA